MVLFRSTSLVMLFIMAFSFVARSQSFEGYSFVSPEIKYLHNTINKLLVVDSRANKTNLGFIQTGVFNKQTTLIAKPDLQEQFNNILSASLHDTTDSPELLIQLHQLSFAERTTFSSEKGYFSFRADLYVKHPEGYSRIKRIDTILTLSKVEVTNALLRAGNSLVTDFITVDLKYNNRVGHPVAYQDIVNVDSVTKSKIPVYNTAKFTDGVYFNYESFSKQNPDAQLIIKNNEVIKKNVFTVGEGGRTEKVKPERIYALVYNGNPYIATPYGYYSLKKVNNDFIFTGKIHINNGYQAGSAGMLFGAAGALIASGANSTYAIKIDYTSGEYIVLKQVIDPNTVAAKSADYYEQ